VERLGGLVRDAFLYGGLPLRVALPKAKEAARRAQELDPGIAEAHGSLGTVSGVREWDWVNAKRHLRIALQLGPQIAHLHHWYGNVPIVESRANSEESVRHMRKARDADPASPSAHYCLGCVLMMLYRFEEARIELEGTVAPDAEHPMAMIPGDVERARRHFERTSTFAYRMAGLGHLAAKLGDREGAIRIVRAIEDAMNEVEACAEERDAGFPYVMHTVFGERLHNEPRFQALRPRVRIDWKSFAGCRRIGAGRRSRRDGPFPDMLEMSALQHCGGVSEFRLDSAPVARWAAGPGKGERHTRRA
jgi:hypothetical protein